MTDGNLTDMATDQKTLSRVHAFLVQLTEGQVKSVANRKTKKTQVRTTRARRILPTAMESLFCVEYNCLQ